GPASCRACPKHGQNGRISRFDVSRCGAYLSTGRPGCARMAAKQGGQMATADRGYSDLHEHLDALRSKGQLREIDAPVNKGSEMHSVVRWQFVGGIAEAERKAFLFKNVVDGKGRKYDIPVVIGALAANEEIYATGMGVAVSEIAAKWDRAIAHPIKPRAVN